MFGAYAEKQGGGKSFLFGRKTWKKRWFVVDSERRIGYWESEAHQRSNSPPLKPHLGLDGSVVDVPGDAVVVGDRQVWPFTLRFAEGSGDKAELAMRTDDKPSRDKFVQALMSVGVKATGAGVPAPAPSASAGGAGGADSSSPVDGARGGIKSSTGRVAPVVLSVEGDGSAAAAAAAAASAGRDADAGSSGAAARPAASGAGAGAGSSGSSSSVAPARDVAFSSGSGKTPPPPPPRLTSTSIGTPRRPGAPASGLAGIDAALPAAAAAVVEPAAPAKTEPAAVAEPAAAAAAAAAADGPPGVPKPSPPGGQPPPEVEAAAREAQLAIMEREEQLPPGWTIGSSADGYVFYVSPTGESQWDKPTA